MPHFKIDKNSGQGPGEISVSPTEHNLTQSPIQEYLKVTLGGVTKTIPLVHKVGEVTYRYTFNVSPTNVSVDSLGGNIPYSVESIRESFIGGVSAEVDNNWGYTVDCDEGITDNGGTLSVGANPNSWELTRNVRITQNNSGKTIIINIIQLASSVQTEYTFNVVPVTIDVGPEGGTRNLTITSTKTTTTNGQPQVSELDYTVNASDPSWIHISGNSVTIDATSSEQARTGSITLLQNESGRSLTININQQASIITTEYQFSVSPTGYTMGAGGGSLTLTVTSTKTITTDGVPKVTQLGYTFGSLPSWITRNSNTLTIANNPNTSERFTTITLNQNESGRSAQVTINQDAREIVEGWQYFMASYVKDYNGSPNLPTSDFTSSEHSNSTITDYVIGFKIKTQDGNLTVGSSSWTLKQWLEWLVDNKEDPHVSTLSDGEVNYSCGESWITNIRNIQSYLEDTGSIPQAFVPFIINPIFNISANTSTVSRDGIMDVTIGSNVKTYHYTINQGGAEPVDLSVFEFEDGSTSLNMGTFGTGSTMAKPDLVYNTGSYPKVKIRSLLSDGKPHTSVPSSSSFAIVQNAIEVSASSNNPCILKSSSVGNVYKSDPEIIEYYFGFKADDNGKDLESMWYAGRAGSFNLTIYQLDREGNRTGKSITLRYTLTGFTITYTLRIKAAAIKLYQSEGLYMCPIKSKVYLGILNGDDISYTAHILASPFRQINQVLDYNSDAEAKISIFSWDWDPIRAVEGISNYSTFYFCTRGNVLDGPYSEGEGGFGMNRLTLSPDDPFSISSSKNAFTITVNSLYKKT